MSHNSHDNHKSSHDDHGGHDDSHSHSHHSNISGNQYWEQQLARNSLKEVPFVSKKHWLKPLSSFLTLEYKGRIFKLIIQGLINVIIMNLRNTILGSNKFGIRVH